MMGGEVLEDGWGGFGKWVGRFWRMSGWGFGEWEGGVLEGEWGFVGVGSG